MLSPTLRGDQGIEVRQPCEKRLVAPPWMMQPLHREELPLDSIVGLVSQGAGHRHLRVCKDGIPAGFLVLKPAPYPRAIGRPRRVGDVIGKVP